MLRLATMWQQAPIIIARKSIYPIKSQFLYNPVRKCSTALQKKTSFMCIFANSLGIVGICGGIIGGLVGFFRYIESDTHQYSCYRRTPLHRHAMLLMGNIVINASIGAVFGFLYPITILASVGYVCAEEFSEHYTISEKK